MNSIAASANRAWSATTPTYRPRSTRDAERLVGSQLAREVLQDSQHSSMLGLGRGETELREDRRDVLFDGTLRDHEAARDPHVRVAFGHERQHLPFSCRQRVERLATTASKELSDDVGIEHGASRRDV